MNYKYSTGLALPKFMELQYRIQGILDGRRNIRQAFIANQYGISQPTVFRIYRDLMPLISMALALEVPDLKEALSWVNR